MRTRGILFVVAILLVAAFAALNWSEIARSVPLSFGVFVMNAPLGAILLGLLAIGAVAFALSSAAIRTQALVDSRTHHKTLEAQRTLADKAEASRFTDLRQHLDSQLRELRERDAIAATEFQKAMVNSQRELRTQLAQMNQTLAARLDELGGHLGHAPVAAVTTPDLLREEQALRDAQEHELRREEKAVAAADRPPEAGWRKWF
jgi:DNA anti-recombination protein RmuC